MKKFLRTAAAAAAVVLTAGCTTMEVAQKFNGLPVSEKAATPPTVHMNVSMTGFYFFGCLPIITGSVGSVDKCALFKNTVKVEHAVSVLTREARTQYSCTRIYDLKSNTRTFHLPLLLSIKSVEVSATGTK